jgi:hypothetical protein
MERRRCSLPECMSKLSSMFEWLLIGPIPPEPRSKAQGFRLLRRFVARTGGLCVIAGVIVFATEAPPIGLIFPAVLALWVMLFLAFLTRKMRRAEAQESAGLPR